MAINIGAINFTVDANTAGLRRAAQEMENFRRVVDATARSQAQGAERAAAALGRQESAMKKAYQQAVSLHHAMKQAAVPPGMLAPVTAAFAKLRTEMASGVLNSTNFARAVDAFNAKMGRASRGLKDFKATKAAQEAEKFRTLLEDIGSAAVLAAGPLSGLGSRINAVTAIAHRSSGSLLAMVLGFSALSAGMYAGIQVAINTGREMERTSAVLTTVSGSSAFAAHQFKELVAVSQELAQPISVSTEMYAKLAAATKYAGVSGKDTMEVFRGILTAGTALNLNNMQLENSFRAVVQMFSKGKVQAEELRGQLGEQMPGAFQLFARSMGVTTQELDKMLRKGQVGADSIIKFGKALQIAFGPGAARAVNTTQSEINKMNNSFFLLGDSINKTFGVLELFKGGVRTLGNVAQWSADHMNQLKNAVYALAAGLLALTAPRILMGLKSIATMLGVGAAAGGAGAAAAGLSRLLPLLGRIGIVGGVAAGTYYLMNKYLSTSVDTYKDATEAAKEFLDMTKGIGAGKEAKTFITDMLDKEIQKTREALNVQQDYIQQASKYSGQYGHNKMVKDLGRNQAAELFKNSSKAPQEVARLNQELAKLIGLRDEVNAIPLLEADKNVAEESQKVLGLKARIEDMIIEYQELSKLKRGDVFGGKITEDTMRWTNALIDAKQTLNDLNNEEMAAFTLWLEKQGIAGENTTDKLKNLIAANAKLRNMLKEQTKEQKLLDAQRQVGLRIGTEMALANEKLAAVNKGPIALLHWEQEKERARTLVRLNKEMERVKFTEEQRNIVLKAYEEQMIAVQRAEEFAITASSDLAAALSSALGDISTGADNASDAIRNLGNTIRRIAYENMVGKPLERLLGGLFENMGLNTMMGNSYANTAGRTGSMNPLNWIMGLFGMGGGGNMFSGLFGGGGGSGFGVGGLDFGGGGMFGGGGLGTLNFGSGSFASGGVVAGTGKKRIDAHGGEVIFTPEQMKALGKSNRGGSAIVNVYNNANGTDSKVTSRQGPGGIPIVDIVIDALQQMGSDGRLERAMAPLGVQRQPHTR